MENKDIITDRFDYCKKCNKVYGKNQPNKCKHKLIEILEDDYTNWILNGKKVIKK